MGLFDSVNFRIPCPTCGRRLTDFQSKDGPCLMGRVEPLEVNNFYTLCPECRTWVEYNRKPATSLDDYDLQVETPEKHTS